MTIRLFPLIALVASVLFAGSMRADEHQGHFRHVVCFQFKEGTSKSDIAAIEKAFGELPSKIDTIVDYEWGISENIEPLNDGFTHCFLVTFKDKKGLEVYLPHVDHQAFVSLLKPKLEKVFVFDYTVR
ncbi:MAG: Dabb family protein [Verrucomicrobiae bacterium]|nr:Dabb family protein [Verrucomicrobiae bacterium]